MTTIKHLETFSFIEKVLNFIEKKILMLQPTIQSKLSAIPKTLKIC